MDNVELYHIAFLLAATALDIVANIFLKYSNGFKKIIPGILSLFFVVAAFLCLSETVKGMDLSVAYALWGGLGIVATAILGRLIFKQKLNWRGWLGIIVLIVGMIMIKFA